jgi:hypothetical protein
MNRKAIGIVILILWMAGVAVLLRRNFGGDINRRLTEAAIRVQPETYYYSLFYRGAKIGAASSAIDTLVAALIDEEYYTGKFPSGDSLAPVSARLRSRMTRGFRLTNISLDLERGGKRVKMSAFVQADTTLVVIDARSADSTAPHIIGLHGPLLPPSLIGVALLLGETTKAGLEDRFIVFNPVDAKPEWHEVRVVGDSLFAVVDSAAQSAAGKWEEAHSDTVRAWRLGGATSSLTIWVDAEGRIVEAAAPNGLRLTRTAFELAFETARTR